MGARALVKSAIPAKAAAPEKVFNPGRRPGSVTEAEQSLVTQFVRDQPREVTTGQVQALAKVLRRTPAAVREMVERAREEFQAGAEFYVNAHKQAVGLAVANGDAKSLDAAMRGAAWALENLSAEGVRVVDKQKESGGPSGPRIMVNVGIGGLNTTKTDSPESTQTVQIEGVVATPEDSQ